MNPKDLKVGDRIRIEAVVKQSQLEGAELYFEGARANVTSWLEASELNCATIITPSVPEEGEWKPKYLEDIKGITKGDIWIFAKYGCPCPDGGHIAFNDLLPIKLESVRPIAKPLTMEEELEEILEEYWNRDVQNLCDWRNIVLAWHTKHTPPQRNMPTWQEFHNYASKHESKNGWLGSIKAAFAHFGLNDREEAGK